DEKWQYRIKLSNDLIKVSNPGILQIARTADECGQVVEDLLYDELDDTFVIPEGATPLLTPVVKNGKRVLEHTPIDAIRDRARTGWTATSGNTPPVRLTAQLEETKKELLIKNGFNA
ncbi:MAG: hypothetical protein HRU46_07330, partial [Verrucomicrobiales bacterium]|nr:hypothetical protein [Verrucomicrobiales bacterium]